jgi:hypothetical protein
MHKNLLSLLILVTLAGLGQAQTLAEVSLVAAIASELNPAIKLPSGSLRAVSDDLGPIIALVPNHEAYDNWEVYSAGGISTSLRPVFIQQTTTAFALAGYFLEHESREQVGEASHSSFSFTDGVNQTLLYMIETPTELIYYIARAK